MAAGLIEAVIAAMADRGVSQSALAASVELSQGHLSKILRGLDPGELTARRLRAWVDNDDATRLDPEEIARLGRLLKRKCDELAELQRRAGAVAAIKPR